MKITKELLKEKGACADGYRDFLKEYPVDKYPDGVEYQELLDCCAEKNFEYGSWLLEMFGRTDEVRKIGGDLIIEKGIIFAGQLEVKGCIEAGDGIKAGWGIEAKQYIHAEKRIFAGVSVYHTSQNCEKTIKCAELRKGEICYGDLVIEEPVVEMTIEEIEQKLGIKNLKIKER